MPLAPDVFEQPRSTPSQENAVRVWPKAGASFPDNPFDSRCHAAHPFQARQGSLPASSMTRQSAQ
eukprot:15434770-Alexandrium_andersonii.AAC.1